MTRQTLVHAETEILLQKNGKFDVILFVDGEEVNSIRNADTYEQADELRQEMAAPIKKMVETLKKMSF